MDTAQRNYTKFTEKRKCPAQPRQAVEILKVKSVFDFIFRIEATEGLLVGIKMASIVTLFIHRLPILTSLSSKIKKVLVSLEELELMCSTYNSISAE
ncbi:MAG: hypothetical protein K6T88_21100 [Bacillus sp. (in: Bacteria)]|nr:hypothetical protein [Bacillus sp. (in: firmicutes)]